LLEGAQLVIKIHAIKATANGLNRLDMNAAILMPFLLMINQQYAKKLFLKTVVFF